MNVVVIGRGKVARAIQARLGKSSHRVKVLASRGRLPKIGDDVELIVLAVRDDAIEDLARRLAATRARPLGAAVIHVAGALGPEVLGALSGRCAGIGRAHPLASFASRQRVPDLRGALWLMDGERVAVARARQLGLALGCLPRRWPGVTPAAYHAAAALTANGAATLAAASARVLVGAGAPPREVARAVGVLLRSVAENVGRVGLPEALTGPVRRGDARTVSRHLHALAPWGQEITELYRVCALAQLPLAAALGEASAADLARVRRVLGPKRPRRRRV